MPSLHPVAARGRTTEKQGTTQAWRWRRPGLPPPHYAPPPRVAGIGTIVTALIRSRIIFRRLQTYIVSEARHALFVAAPAAALSGSSQAPCVPAWHAPPRCGAG